MRSRSGSTSSSRASWSLPLGSALSAYFATFPSGSTLGRHEVVCQKEFRQLQLNPEPFLSMNTRWGQIYILDSLLSYTPMTSFDAETLAERISVRLQHANSAVVLTTIKVILYLMNYMEDERVMAGLERKMGPPLGASFSLPHFSRPR